MLRFEAFHRRVQVSVFSFIAVCTVITFAQTDGENSPWGKGFDKEVTFTIMSETERQSYQLEQAKTLKEELASSRLDAEHQHLIAEALSIFYGGVPVGSYREDSVTKSTKTKEFLETFRSISILDNGFVKVEGSNDRPLRWFGTPYDHIIIPLSSWDLSTGRVISKRKSQITFRFDEFTQSSREGEEFDEAYETISDFLCGMELVAEITIDKNSRNVFSYSDHLLRSFGKMFVFRVRKFDDVKDYQFVEDCGCMVISNETAEVGASAIFAGRFDEQVNTTYTEMKFEKPLRFVLPDLDHYDL